MSEHSIPTAKRTFFMLVIFFSLTTALIWSTFPLLFRDYGLSGVEYLGSTYRPSAFCPGDIVHFHKKYRVNEPVSLIATWSIAVEGGETVYARPLGDSSVINIIEPRVIVDTDSYWVVPDLPVGRYVRNYFVGPTYRNMQPIWFQESFWIEDSCFDEEK